MKEYITYDGIGLAELVRKKEVSPTELVDAAFNQIDKKNPEINAVIRTRKEKVYEEAKSINPTIQPFAGVPILLKDLSQAVKGERVTSGTKLLESHIARSDSNLVATLRQNGFLFAGHTNVPEFGLKNITEPSLHGAARNPWNLAYSPGGSSGGAAASVASGMVPVAGASDGGGSIRIPASFTGLVGLKPTRGRTPVGPGAGRQWQGAAVDFVVSRTVRDSAAMLDILQTVQPEAAFQTPLYSGSYLNNLTVSTPTYRVAFSTKSPVGTPVSEEAKQAVHRMVHWLEAQGHVVEEKENGVDGIRLMQNYYTMNNGEMAATIMSMEKAIGREITLSDIEIVSWVLYTAGKQVSAVDYTNSIAQWDVAAAQMAAFHQTYDLYITPATAYAAPKVGELNQSQKEVKALMEIATLDKQAQADMVYQMFLPSLSYTPFTQLANLTGQPAISVPTHLTENGLPLGVQLMASKGREDMLLQLAYQLEQSSLWVGMEGNAAFK